MTEEEFIQKLKELRTIKPRKDWVILTKSRIFGSEPEKSKSLFFLSRLKPVFIIPALAILIMIGITFNLAQDSVPGDLLYSVKKIEEVTQLSLSSKDQLPQLHLELANQRLQDLDKVAQANRIKNLASTIQEFQDNISEAAEGLKATTSDSQPNPLVIKKIAEKTEELNKKKEKIENSYGIIVGETEKLDIALADVVKREIEDLEESTLTDAQQPLLQDAEEAYEGGNFIDAMTKIIKLSQQ